MNPSNKTIQLGSSPGKRNNKITDVINELSRPQKIESNRNTFKSINKIIKINKGKLPADFFPKSWFLEKKIPQFKLNLKQQGRSNNKMGQRRIQSQRLHISPQKTSFFGFFQRQCQSQQNQSNLISIDKLSLRRKFQSRDQPKRDNSQQKRRLTPVSNSQINDLQIFPISNKMQKILVSHKNLNYEKLSPRKGNNSKYRQIHEIIDPQKKQLLSYNVEEDKCKFLKFTFGSKGQSVDLHNLTFFNIKSSCLPPIKNQNKIG